MANYTIDRSLTAAGSITVTEATTDTSTNVTLVGQNFTGYGDEIATNFLQMLENFAADVEPNNNPRVPGSSAITGQLWYDTANSVLKVFGGTTWEEQAKVTSGATTDSVLRWNNANGRYDPEERVRVSDAGVLTLDVDATGTNRVDLSHDGTTFSIAGVGTHAQTRFTGGNVEVRGGNEFRVYEAGGTQSLEMLYVGTDAVIRTVATNDLDITGSLANLRVDAAIAIEERASAPADVAGYGQVWVSNSVPAELYYTDDTGQDVQITNNGAIVSSGGGGNVSNTGTPVNNQVAVWTSATVIEGVAGFTWDGTNLSATQFGGIAEANLLDKTATETVSGAYTFSSAVTFQGDLDLQDNDRILFGTGDDVAVDFDGSSFVIDALVGTPDLDINGFLLVNSDSPIYGTDLGGAVQGGINVVGSASTWSTTDSKIAFYDSDQTETGMLIGTEAGSSTAIVNSRIGALDLYASDSRIMEGLSFAQTFYASGSPTAIIQSAFTANHSSSILVYDRNGENHPVGFNGSPLADNVLDDINTGDRTVSLSYIGKMVSRTTSTSRQFTLNNVSNIPVGATILLHNGAIGGTFTIVQGSATLQWVDGSGSSPAVGTRTLANNSVATLRKSSNAATNVWQIWGNGLS